MKARPRLRTCLWFDSRGEEAARLYLSLLPESRIKSMHRTDPEGPAPVVEFTLAVLPGWRRTAAPAAT